MSATAQVVASNSAIEENWTWSEPESSPLQESYPVDDQPENMAVGLVWGVFLAGILWTILILAGREAWRLLH
ncbi:MAG: hypothetical protein ACRD3N_02145 [Terracidiphilus sp.]